MCHGTATMGHRTPPLLAALVQLAAAAACCWPLALVPPATAATAPSCAAATVSVAAAATQRKAQSVRGDALVEEALQSVGVRQDSAARAGQELAELGLETALDLWLLGDTEAGEVLAEARMRGLLSIGERAKLRLAMGEPALSARLHGNEAWASAASCSGGAGSFPCAPESDSARRRVQSEAAAGSDSLSMDTIAIVLSVLVGAAGYVVQAHTARRAERAAASQLASCIV